MWLFLFILALVPLIFYWSDSVRELFPELESYLPAKESSQLIVDATPNKRALSNSSDATNTVNEWVLVDNEQTFIAWALSYDGQYRLAVGCYKEGEPTIQITTENPVAAQKVAALNFEYGILPMVKGVYQGPELVGSVAQFSKVILQTHLGEVLAEYELPGNISGFVAREIENNCNISNTR